MSRVRELQDRVRTIEREAGASLLPWNELANRSGPPRGTLHGLRVGELRYRNENVAGGELLAPATLTSDPPGHLLLARPPADEARATSLLNSLALRFALAAPPDRLRILLVDAFEDGRSALGALRGLRPPRVTFGRPSGIQSWLADRYDEASLVVVYHTHLEDDAPEEVEQAFREAHLRQLVDRLRDRAAGAMLLLAFDPARRDHPLAVAAEDRSLPAVRVTLGSPGEDRMDGVEVSSTAPVFTPDECPATDVAEGILARSGRA